MPIPAPEPRAVYSRGWMGYNVRVRGVALLRRVNSAGWRKAPRSTASLSRYTSCFRSGRGAVRLARLHGVQEVPGSIPGAPTLFYLYILYSRRTRRYYVGSTQDIARRLREHNAGKSLSTRAGVPWELVRAEGYATRAEAVRRETLVKSRGIGRYLESLHISSSG